MEASLEAKAEALYYQFPRQGTETTSDGVLLVPFSRKCITKFPVRGLNAHVFWRKKSYGLMVFDHKLIAFLVNVKLKWSTRWRRWLVVNLLKWSRVETIDFF